MGNIVKVVLLLFIFLSGCSTKNTDDFKIQYGMKKFERTFGSCDSTGAGCAKILFEFPEIKYAYTAFVKDSISWQIQNILLSNYTVGANINSLDSLSKLFFFDYQDMSKDFPGYNLPWELNNTISVIYNDNSIVSLQSEFYHFTGGVHGNSGVYFTNFNSEDGRKLALSDLLIPNYIRELNLTAEKIFRTQNNLLPDEDLEAAGYWFEGNKFSLNDNFGIKNDGLVFYFNSYEIAPYAMGPTEILIPYKEMKNLVKKDGLLYKLVSEK